jgi:hypothetical protein
MRGTHKTIHHFREKTTRPETHGVQANRLIRGAARWTDAAFRNASTPAATSGLPLAEGAPSIRGPRRYVKKVGVDERAGRETPSACSRAAPFVSGDWRPPRLFTAAHDVLTKSLACGLIEDAGPTLDGEPGVLS